MRLSRLHRKIALRLALVILAASVLIDLVVITGAQQALVRDRREQGRQLLRLGCRGRENMPMGAAAGGVLETVCLDAHFRPLGTNGPLPWLQLDAGLTEKLRRGEDVVYFQGTTWGVLWRQAERMVIVSPVEGSQDGVKGAAGVWSLAPVYHRIRRLHGFVLGYMLVNFLVLELIGLILISRVAIRPLQRLVQRAETCSHEGGWFSVDLADKDDYGRLSHALNQIYGRLQQDRDALAAAVLRLEAANRDLRRARQEVQQAEKLASIGRLSAGLAHEIGNPLGIVTGYLELLREDAMSATERRDILGRIEAETARIARIMRQLLHLARPRPETRKIFPVNDLLRETVEILQNQPFSRRMEIRMQLGALTDRVSGDPESLRQVFLNLMINAADAVGALDAADGGAVTIRSENTQSAIRILFQDNGVGIAPEHLPLIFDPFFTTKKPGQGTGLGLAVSFMIVEALGGHLKADSRPGQGTTLEVQLPLADENQEQGAKGKGGP
ncbi:MAG: ATP-binding protein [Desulfobacteraceae bacterium]|jgi:signal transduction histidine kinase|nr:ATP-binding protein [Desulfobacteraceae bacterium]